MAEYEYKYFIQFEKGSGWYRFHGPVKLEQKLAIRFLKHMRNQVNGTKIKIRAERRKFMTWEQMGEK